MPFLPGRSSYGPYNVLLLVGAEGKRLESFPYSSIKGSQFQILVSDNVARYVNQGGIEAGFEQFFAIAEIGIWGTVNGRSALLKRQAVRMLTGPMNYYLPGDLPYQEIEIRARNMSGGMRGTPVGGILQPQSNPPYNQPFGAAPPPQTGGYLLEATISFQKVTDDKPKWNGS